MNNVKSFSVLMMLMFFSMNLLAKEDPAAELQNHLKTYFNDVHQKVKNENDLQKKREILNSSIIKLESLFKKVSEMPAIYPKDKNAISGIQTDLKNKFNELNGLNGFEKIQDKDLNDYAGYLVQDLEQADKYVTISITTLSLILILVILLVKPF